MYAARLGRSGAAYPAGGGAPARRAGPGPRVPRREGGDGPGRLPAHAQRAAPGVQPDLVARPRRRLRRPHDPARPRLAEGARARALRAPAHGERATRFRHVLDERLGLDRGELAVLAVLVLRGPQTVGELRTRTERQHTFASTSTRSRRRCARLAEREEPLVVAAAPPDRPARGPVGAPARRAVDVEALAAALARRRRSAAQRATGSRSSRPRSPRCASGSSDSSASWAPATVLTEQSRRR